MKMPVTFEQFSKDPVKALLFVCLIVVGYLYYDYKTLTKERRYEKTIQIEKLENKVNLLEKKVDLLNAKLIECAKYMAENE